MPENDYKPIKFKLDIHKSIQELATELGAERGRAESLQNVVAEAVKFMKENRKKPEEK